MKVTYTKTIYAFSLTVVAGIAFVGFGNKAEAAGYSSSYQQQYGYQQQQGYGQQYGGYGPSMAAAGPSFMPVFKKEPQVYPDPIYYPPMVSYNVEPVTIEIPERFWNPFYSYYQTETAASYGGQKPNYLQNAYAYPYASKQQQAPYQYQYQQQFQQQYQYQNQGYQQSYTPPYQPPYQPSYQAPYNYCCYYGKQ